MSRVVYYDTNAFAHFFISPFEETKSHLFSPQSRIIRGHTNIVSPFIVEEFLFNFFTKQKWRDRFPPRTEKRIHKLTEIHAYLSFFDIKAEEVELNKLTNLFVTLVLTGIDHGIVRKEGEDGLDIYDFLHLSYCLLAGAESFLTSDSGFKKVNPYLKEQIAPFKLQRIIIYPTDDFRGSPKTVFVK